MKNTESSRSVKSNPGGESKESKNEKILIVDDEPAFVEALRRTLEAKSYQVMSTSSKSLAQEMMKAEPDLVVLGTLAPAGEAFSLYQWLGHSPSVPSGK